MEKVPNVAWQHSSFLPRLEVLHAEGALGAAFEHLLVVDTLIEGEDVQLERFGSGFRLSFTLLSLLFDLEGGLSCCFSDGFFTITCLLHQLLFFHSSLLDELVN